MAEQPTDLKLSVNGTDYGGWTRVRVHRGLEEIAGHFDIEATETWPAKDKPREIHAGDKCTVQAGDATSITGNIDAVSVSYDNASHSVRVSGRDVTGDLVDGSAIHQGWEWKNANLDQIARDLAKPYGITVKVETDLGKPFPTWAIQEGESVFECLERAARTRGVLLMSDGKGALVLGRPSKEHTGVTLERGVNIEAAMVENNQAERYSEYIVKGQKAGDDHSNGEPIVAQKSRATDPGVTRYRPLVIVMEDQGEISNFGDRAKYEATVRAARALRATIHVAGWRHPGGVWEPNRLVHVRDQWLGLDRDLLIAEVDLVLDEQGSRAELCLTIPEAYSLLAVPPKKKKGRKGKAAKDFDDGADWG